jgi:hypothetical protein
MSAGFAGFGWRHRCFPADFDEVRMDPRQHCGKPAATQRQDFPLLEHLNLSHPLIVLAKLIDWDALIRPSMTPWGRDIGALLATAPDRWSAVFAARLRSV